MKRQFIFGILAGAAIFIGFQNCAQNGFVDQMSLSSASSGISSLQSCPSNQIQCETDQGYGQQTCTNQSNQNALLGPCLVSSCKTGFAFANGSCVSISCTPGATVSCDLSHGSGNRVCDVTGKYGACSNPVCNQGYALNSDGACVGEILEVLVNGKNEFTAVASNLYSVNVTASADAALNNSLSSLTAVSGSCAANRSWAPIGKALKPWTLDGTSSGMQLKLGANAWSYAGATAQDMAGCQWKGCLVTTFGTTSCLTIDTVSPATTTTTTMTPTTLKPTTTTTTLKPTTTTTTLKPTTTTMRPTTTTTQPLLPCYFQGQYASGQSIKLYPNTYVPYGQTCVQNTFTCNNGNWLPVFPGGFTTCQVDPPPPTTMRPTTTTTTTLKPTTTTLKPTTTTLKPTTTTLRPTTTTTTLPPKSCSGGLSSTTAVNNSGQTISLCGYACSSPRGVLGVIFYTCPNGVTIATSPCQGGPSAGAGWNRIVLTFVPTQTQQYVCKYGNIYP